MYRWTNSILKQKQKQNRSCYRIGRQTHWVLFWTCRVFLLLSGIHTDICIHAYIHVRDLDTFVLMRSCAWDYISTHSYMLSTYIHAYSHTHMACVRMSSYIAYTHFHANICSHVRTYITPAQACVRNAVGVAVM